MSGPHQPPLTIVDLPGLIHSGKDTESDKDVEIVHKMVHGYMSNRRSIILAIVSAKNDTANQKVLKMSREVDIQGRRTIGVITKPDEPPRGSESEASYMKLAQNMDIYFRFGWHVLRNRKFEEKGTSAACRDETER